jgi:hypothetical protein
MADLHTAPQEKRSAWYRYVILGIGFVTLAGGSGTSSAFAVFYSTLLQVFSWSHASAASMYSVNMLVLAVSAPLAEWLRDRCGPRWVFTTAAACMWVLCAAQLCMSITMIMVNVHLVEFLVSGGILDILKASTIFSAVSLVSLGGRMFFGWLVDRLHATGAFTVAMVVR